jgi:hypothetical protein
MSVVEGLTSAARAPAASSQRAPGRADWPELPRRPIRASRTGWLAPGREIAQSTRWVLRALSLLVPLVTWIGLSASGTVQPEFLPTPAATWKAGLEMARSHDVEEAVFLGRRVVVLASDPGRVAAEISIDLPAERTPGTRRTPEFLALRTEVEDLVRAQHVRVGQAESSGVAASTTMG